MSIAFTLNLMIFLHIVDDFYLQGILANLKQKKYWEENAPDVLYKYDYRIALWLHSFSWTFMIMLPIAYHMQFNITLLYTTIFFINMVVHGITDNSKANNRKISLTTDQLIHLLQIFITAHIFL